MRSMRRRDELRGTAQPTLTEEPLFVRLCTAFVDNLGLILKTAMLLAAAVFVQELQSTFGGAEQADQLEPAPAIVTTNPVAPSVEDEVSEPVLSEGVMQALNCTFAEYRNTHYDECVSEPSQVYPKPIGEDPGGAWFHDPAPSVLLARLDEAPSPR